MAKYGTMRDGARVGSGRKSKALTEKIDRGLAATVIDLPEPAEINGENVPPVITDTFGQAGCQAKR